MDCWIQNDTNKIINGMGPSCTGTIFATAPQLLTFVGMFEVIDGAEFQAEKAGDPGTAGPKVSKIIGVTGPKIDTLTKNAVKLLNINTSIKRNDFKDIHILPKKIEKSSPSKVVVSGISERRIFCGLLNVHLGCIGVLFQGSTWVNGVLHTQKEWNGMIYNDLQ